MKGSRTWRNFSTTNIQWVLAIGLTLSLAVASGTLQAQTPETAQAPNAQPVPNRRVIVPLIVGYYNGQVADYLLTETSDQTVAQELNVNYSPILANAISGGAVDDIYQVTNFNQGRVLASAPLPAGPGNTNQNYSPDWQLNLVTWNTTPRLLMSEQQILNAEQQGLLSVVKTGIVVNCPVIFTPSGGLFPGAQIIGGPPNGKVPAQNGVR